MIIKFKDRNNYILKALIKEYTRTGEPVASEILNVKYRLGVSSATIRNDFVMLTEEGYLYKPYVSSGRIPTDKAWKFFIDNIFENENDSLGQWEGRLKNQLLKIKLKSKPNINFIKEIKKLLDIISEESHSLSFCYLFQKNEIIKQGLKYIFAAMIEEESLTHQSLQQTADSLEKLDEKLKNIEIDENPLVLIGKENPFMRSDQFSSVLSAISKPKAILGILGPKRMPYERNIAILRAVTNLIS